MVIGEPRGGEKLQPAAYCYCFYKNNKKEDTYLVAVVVVGGNVDFRPMSCTSDGLRCGLDLENGSRIGEQAEYRGRSRVRTTQLSAFSTGARPRLHRSPRHSVGICNKLHSFNGLAVPLFEQESSAAEDNQDIGIGIGIGPVREVGYEGGHLRSKWGHWTSPDSSLPGRRIRGDCAAAEPRPISIARSGARGGGQRARIDGSSPDGRRRGCGPLCVGSPFVA